MLADVAQYDAAMSGLGHRELLQLYVAARGAPRAPTEIVAEVVAAGRKAAEGREGPRWDNDEPLLHHLLKQVRATVRTAGNTPKASPPMAMV